jgi:hypothetical protein
MTGSLPDAAERSTRNSPTATVIPSVVDAEDDHARVDLDQGVFSEDSQTDPTSQSSTVDEPHLEGDLLGQLGGDNFSKSE